MSITPEQVVTRKSAYYNERSKFKRGPVFNAQVIWAGSQVMVYNYDLERHVSAEVTRVDPEVILYITPESKIEHSYSSKMAHEFVENTELPHVYLMS